MTSVSSCRGRRRKRRQTSNLVAVNAGQCDVEQDGIRWKSCTCLQRRRAVVQQPHVMDGFLFAAMKSDSPTRPQTLVLR